MRRCCPIATAKILVTRLQHSAQGLWSDNLMFDGKPITFTKLN